VGDITFISTAEGWLYLAVSMDLYSRMIVGWAMNESPNRSPVTDALEMALGRRGKPSELLIHTD
tara:strand:+ start:4258 stop:4449 length:192 start_codon:yes stop_codon:yes gene_type:complete